MEANSISGVPFNGFWLNNQPRNQSFANHNFDHLQHMDSRSLHSIEDQSSANYNFDNFQYVDARPLHSLEDHRLRINAAARGQYVSPTNQQIPLEDQLQRLRIDGPSRGPCVSPTNQQVPERFNFNHYDRGTGTGSVHDPYGRRMFMGQRHHHFNEHHCRFLMRKLNNRNPRGIPFILSDVMDHLHDLMKDECGNRVVQKLFEVVSEDQMTRIINMIIGNEHKFMDVCINHYGSRAVQGLAGHLKTPEQLVAFTIALKRITVTLTKTLDGGYVVQHFLKISHSAASKLILDEIADNCIEIATHKSGCSVIQKCLSIAIERSMAVLVQPIITHAVTLARDKYGNYVVQFLIKMAIAPTNAAIVQLLRGRYIELSINKFASNVVDDLIEFSEEVLLPIIICEIMDSPSFLHILQNPFGNYVVQKALQHSTGPLQNALLRRIFLYHTYLRSDPYGKKVLASARRYWNQEQIL